MITIRTLHFNKNHSFGHKAKNTPLSKSLNLKQIIIRTMFRSKLNQTTNLVRPIINQPSRQYYPGKYELIKYRKILSDDEKRRLNLSEHDATHYNIKNTKTGQLEGLFTSAQNKDGKSPVVFDKLDPTKVNGSFTPLKDKKGNLILNANGNPQPDPNKGGQWMATYPSTRIISKDIIRFAEVDKKAQSYVDDHEAQIENNIIKNRQKYGNRLPIKLGGQDDEPL